MRSMAERVNRMHITPNDEQKKFRGWVNAASKERSFSAKEGKNVTKASILKRHLKELLIKLMAENFFTHISFFLSNLKIQISIAFYR